MGLGRRNWLWAAPSCVLLLAGCPPPSTVGPTIKLGASIDRSANNAEPSWADVIKLAEAQMNAALKESGIDLRFEYTIRDSANDPATTIANSLDLVRNNDARGMILDSSQNDTAANRTFYDTDPTNDLGVPLICCGCTSGSINNPTNADPDPITREAFRNTLGWNFRAIMGTKLLSKVIATVTTRTNLGDYNGDGKLKVAFYGSNEAFGKGAKTDIDASFRTALGCPVSPNPCPNYIFNDILHPGDADANSYPWANDAASLFSNVNTNTQLPDGVPDVLVAAHFAQQDAAFTRAYRSAGTSLIPDPAKIKVMHFQTFRLQSALRACQDVAEGEEGVSHINLDNGASGEVFKADYETAFGTRVVYRDAIYYDAATVMMLGALIGALPLADPTQVTGPEIAAGMRRTSDVAAGEVVRTGTAEFVAAIDAIRDGRSINYEGTSGPMDFDASQNVLDRLAHWQVQGGAFTDVEKFDCVSSSACPLVAQ